MKHAFGAHFAALFVIESRKARLSLRTVIKQFPAVAEMLRDSEQMVCS